MSIIDFHTHAFPDPLAERAMKALQEEGDIPAYLDGRITSLLGSMDRCGIERCVVCSIATKSAQSAPILKWSRAVASDRIVPFPSFHPDDPGWRDRIAAIKDEGFQGVKWHPYYQEFDIVRPDLFRIYEELGRAGLILLLHTGYDFSFVRTPLADPARILTIAETFPELKLVATHLGAWEIWDEVERLLVGRPVYMEISFAGQFMSRERAASIMSRHPAEYLLFGTDSPWADQSAALAMFRGLGLAPAREALILGGNAARLLA
jgi:uncharacterized protein